MYNVDYFINKFEAIPENEWHTGHYSNYDNTAHCALGHCGEGIHKTKESKHLSILIRTNLDDRHFAVPNINDGENEKYQQPTPKQRILAALYDIKKVQTPQYQDITKELAVFPEERVEVDVKVKETV